MSTIETKNCLFAQTFLLDSNLPWDLWSHGPYLFATLLPVTTKINLHHAGTIIHRHLYLLIFSNLQVFPTTTRVYQQLPRNLNFPQIWIRFEMKLNLIVHCTVLHGIAANPQAVHIRHGILYNSSASAN